MWPRSSAGSSSSSEWRRECARTTCHRRVHTRQPATACCQCRQLDEPDVLDDGSEQGDAWAAYYADGDGGGCADDGGGEPVFSAELGLAIEAPRDGLSVGQLWSLLL